MSATSQYAFSLPLPEVFSEGNFYVCECNREAHALINSWPDWPSHAALLIGETGSGKSHLGQIWAERAKASIITARELKAKEPMAGNALIEDIDHMSDERALLHALNYSKEQKSSLLLTSEKPASELAFTLPDLTSRLKALMVATITTPDEEALAAIMRKQFADRQLKVADDVIAFLLPRMERSFAQVRGLVATLDNEALMQRKT